MHLREMGVNMGECCMGEKIPGRPIWPLCRTSLKKNMPIPHLLLRMHRVWDSCYAPEIILQLHWALLCIEIHERESLAF